MTPAQNSTVFIWIIRWYKLLSILGSLFMLSMGSNKVQYLQAQRWYLNDTSLSQYLKEIITLLCSRSSSQLKEQTFSQLHTHTNWGQNVKYKCVNVTQGHFCVLVLVHIPDYDIINQWVSYVWCLMVRIINNPER